MEYTHKKLGMLLGAVLLGTMGWLGLRSDATAPGSMNPGQTPILVEVYNGTKVNGLARTVTRHLRRRGADVVYYGSDNDTVHPVTSILVRRGDTLLGVAVREMLGFGTVRMEEDARRLLDVSVVLGLDAADSVGLRP